MRFRRRGFRGRAPLVPRRQAMSRREYAQWHEAHGWDPARASELAVQEDLSPAAWIAPLLPEDSYQVRGFVPQGFEAYARIFFPFVGEDFVVEDFVGEDSAGPGSASEGIADESFLREAIAGEQMLADEEPRQELITWTEMARRNGRVAHALMEAETILTSPAAGPAPGQAPGPTGADETAICIGSLSGDQFAALLPILVRHTSSATSWFLLWDGFGNLSETAFRHAPVLSHPLRKFYLLHGPHHGYGDFPDEPNYWWPEDRAWCVCTDTDFDWAYLAGSAACIDEVISVPLLDAYPMAPA